jgi:hypothetical protein
MDSPWILTASGRKYHYLANDPTEFHVPDIAAALSRMCRYGGHLSDKYDDDIYSVAQHSVYVYWLLVKVGAPTRALPWAIAHDMPEAYWTDVPSPLKSILPEYKRLENGAADLMCGHLGIPHDDDIEKIVKWADTQILYAESIEITSIPSELWDTGSKVEYTLQDIDPNFCLWRPRLARKMFLQEYDKAMKYATKQEGIAYANAS